jgi:hypothetical protein
MVGNINKIVSLVPWIDSLIGWLNENRLAAVVTLVLGIVLRDLIPYLWRSAGKALVWIGKHIGGEFGFIYFERTYLNWLVTELRELKLAGIVSSDASKKPKLEQVPSSLCIRTWTKPLLRQ